MLSLKRILRDYQQAGSVNSLLAIWGFVDEHTFLTKAGHVGIVYRLAGIDYECLDQAQRRDVVHRFEAALRLLDESCRVYQYLCKRRIDPIEAVPCRQPIADKAIQGRVGYLNGRRAELHEIDAVSGAGVRGRSSRVPARARACGDSGGSHGRAMREWLSTKTTCALLEAELDRAIAQLHHRASAFEVQLADSVRPSRLGKADAFQFFRRLVNYAPHKATGAALKYDTHLDYFVADSLNRLSSQSSRNR